jgi:hypothetical protein
MLMIRVKEILVKLINIPFFGLYLLLLIAAILRGLLVKSGGQYFFVDEARFINGHYLLSSIINGSFSESIECIVSNPAHTGFVIFSSIAETIRYLYLFIITSGSIHPYELTLNPNLGIAIATFTLSLPSVINIALLYAIIRRIGGKKGEALLGAALMTSSCSMFYLCRHLVPYDCALMLVLIALWIGVKPVNNLKNSFACGFIACLGLLTYNGTWTLSIIVCLIHVLWKKNGSDGKLKAFVITALGGIIPLLLLQFISLALDRNFANDLLDWAKATSGNQMGDFGIGWRVLFQYLWETEHLILILWMAGIVISFYSIIKGRTELSLSKDNLGVYAFLSIYLLLIIGSDILENFVIYDRIARMVVPFMCIAGSFPLFKIMNRSSNLSVLLICSAVVIQTAINFSYPFRIMFPDEVRKLTNEKYGKVNLASSYKGENISVFDLNATNSVYTLFNANKLIPPLKGLKDIPNTQKIFTKKHPYQYKPYQYLHFKEKERNLIRKTNLKMTLIKIPNS